jgi:hypothetical protein
VPCKETKRYSIFQKKGLPLSLSDLKTSASCAPPRKKNVVAAPSRWSFILQGIDMPSSRQGARAPFSFHCTICYDAFNLTDRAPVVLPCGHTYLCEPCSKRLDKCMECRTPLYTKVEKEVQESSVDVYSPLGHAPRSRASAIRSSYRNSGAGSTSSPSGRPVYEKIPLPIPKNHVLMCLMDAVQKSSEKELDTDGYESGQDDELVLRGMKVMGSSSGTYTVRERKGLTVHPVRPKANKNKPKGAGITTLKYGQTVQIFLFENKIATIARGAGYILVDHASQLVKGTFVFSIV